MKRTYILAIESSCDDTSVAILENDKVLSNIIATQDVHKEYGGVVPELASRAHQQNIIPVVDTALKRAGIKKEQLDAIAFTEGPGLLGSLIVGASFAKSLALGLGIPLIAVDHLKAHIISHFIQDNEAIPNFPFLCLTVSGGHTMIVKVDSPTKMEILGKTIDDAAGEAFDKIAKIMGLPYPGGPLVDKYAQLGDSDKFSFPHPKTTELNFSFSGLKTSVLYFLKKEVEKDPNFVQNNLNDLCASVQKTIVDILLKNLILASKKTNIKEIAIAGGVSANSRLRMEIQRLGNEKDWNTYIPKFEYCTDNAAMIGILGYFKYLEGSFVNQRITPKARIEF
ncbi:MAG: tRNA (adenosine(37)-N6)-threonylcarbamoyltransferase complex transferase subunit TsaD [Crocinitomicaceae bacterium]|nr:tRNA (adenosine(37)-N6)-threonylcarbamoyltransferase complex transferase subunit TsaD [Crocinitomicaceae bacterium]